MHRILDRAITSLHNRNTQPRHIAWTLAVHTSTVQRHIATIQPSMLEKNRPNRPRKPRIPLTVAQQCTVIAFYCQSTPPPGMQKWTLRIAAKQLNARPRAFLDRTVHHSTIARILARHRLRPHKIAYFLHVRDPMFIEKMHHVLAVYEKHSDYTFCFDECPNIQAISRSGPDAPQTDGRVWREFVYKRNGTTDLFGFLQVSTGKIAAYCRPSHETETLIEVFSAHVRSQPQGEQLHYICDNLFPHFNEQFCKTVARLSGAPPPSTDDLSNGENRRQWLQRQDKRIVVHFLPFHGSWLNQVEIWFGLLRRYTLVGSWFESVDALIAAILAFARTWNDQLAHPFDFRYSGDGLEGVVLRRFTRILSQKPEHLRQLDSKFLADMSLLSVRLIDHHRDAVSDEDWYALTEVVKIRKPELETIIKAETGPLRRRRAQEAFRLLWQHVHPAA